MEVKILDQNNERVVVIEGRVDTVTAPDLEMKVSPLWLISGITLVLPVFCRLVLLCFLGFGQLFQSLLRFGREL